MKGWVLWLSLACIYAEALQQSPWLGTYLSTLFEPSFTYYYFRNVEGARPKLSEPYNVRLLTLDLGFTPACTWDTELEVEFVHSPVQNWGYRSGALQARYLWLNDLEGDPASLLTGVSVREVSHQSLRDVSMPYHARWNVELTGAMGKEWAEGAFWDMHAWGLMGLGQGSHGYPWLRLLGVWQKNWEDRHRLNLFTQGYFGFGSKEHVNPHHFHGWGNYAHASIDIGTGYGYHTRYWGTIGVEYAYRAYAHVFPQNVQFVVAYWKLPFSSL